MDLREQLFPVRDLTVGLYGREHIRFISDNPDVNDSLVIPLD